MKEQNNVPTINVMSRGIVRNWVIKISDIRRLLIHNSGAEPLNSTYIEIRYNNFDGYEDPDHNENKASDRLTYDKNKIVIMFYKILECMKRCKKPKDDYLLITEDEVYLLSEINITGI